jgi:hypothetical protein
MAETEGHGQEQRTPAAGRGRTSSSRTRDGNVYNLADARSSRCAAAASRRTSRSATARTAGRASSRSARRTSCPRRSRRSRRP